MPTSRRMQRGDPNYRSTTRDVARLIDELRGARDGRRPDLDLRGNGGGFLPEATALTGLFIDRARSCRSSTRARRGSRAEVSRPDSFYAGPLRCWSTATAPRPPRSSPARSRTTARAGGRPAHLRQGHGAEPDLARSLDQKPVERPAHRDHRQVLPRHRREHAASRRGARHRAALAHRQPNEVGESALDDALPWDRIAPV
jgi:carboxyl-terminal processing protease